MGGRTRGAGEVEVDGILVEFQTKLRDRVISRCRFLGQVEAGVGFGLNFFPFFGTFLCCQTAVPYE